DISADKKDIKIVFPFINVPQEWINDFLGIENKYEIDYDNEDIGESFMGFLSEINPHFKENVLAASSFLETHQK
ncbi:MAG: ATPase, partial [Methanobrevibacter sp.]|nr:ATPase [Methanobrevibacter sp.]